MRTSKKILGDKIICEYNSSNIKQATFDTSTKELELTFGSKAVYVYEGVSHEDFTAFDMAESQGKHFNQHIGKKFTFKKKI